MSTPERVSFPCPGPGGEEFCDEGRLYLPDEDPFGPERDCPTCKGTGQVELPSRFEVCHRCRGNGVHDNPAFSNGISAEDFAEDPDFREEYMAGRYDVTCSECDGRRVVPVVDDNTADPRLLEAFRRYQADEAAFRREVEAERRMGA